MEWLTPPQPNLFNPADIICTLCKVNLSLGQWPGHVWTEDHQIRAYAKCGLWDYFDRSNIFVIYCNIPVQPISFMESLRQNCGIELKDFILVPEKPSIAILQFHSSKEYMTFLYHSRQIKVRCGDLIVTHATPATGIMDCEWKSLVKYEGPNQTLNFNENGHIGTTSNFPTLTTSTDSHSSMPGPSSSASSQQLPAYPQGPESVRKLHQLAIDSGWPPPKFERQISDRLAGKYTAKVTINGRVFCSNILAGDYSSACKIVADNCLEAFQDQILKLEREKITHEVMLKAGYDGNAYEDLCRLVRARNWRITGTKQYKSEKNPGQREIYFYSLSINDEEFLSPTGGTTRGKGIAQLSVYCLKKVFNITSHWQTNSPLTTAPCQQYSTMSSSLFSSTRLPPNPHPQRDRSNRLKNKQHSDATPTSNVNFNKQLPISSLSTPTIAPRIPQPVKRKITETEDPVLSTNRNHTVRQMSLNDNNRIATTEELMLTQLARGIQLPLARATNVTASTSTSHNIKNNNNLKPEIEVVFDERKAKENEITQPLPVKICDDRGEIMIVNEVWKKPEDEMQNTNVKVKIEKYASPWPQCYIPKEYINSLKYPVDTLEKICLVCNWEKPTYDLLVSQNTEEGSERFSYKMTLNEMDYKNERVEKTKKMAKDKVAQICLTTLAHNGEIPHPSVFKNVSLYPVRRLENLIISRRLPKSSQDEPKYTVIENYGGYNCEVTLNGERYLLPSTCEKTVREAKKNAAELCLQKLSSSMLLYADGSFTEKAKTILMTMSTEIPTITETDKEIHPKYKSFKIQCENIFTMMKITEEKWTNAEAIVKNMDNLVPRLRAIMYKNWYMKLESYTDYDRLFMFVFKTDNDERKVIAADPKEIENQILQSKEKFPGLTVTTLANTNSARYFKQSVHNFESHPSFVLETDLNTLHEVHLCRLIHYISEFDSRFLPVLSLLRYWAKINEIRFHSLDNSATQNIWGDPFILDLLLVNFLGGAGVIPTASELLQRNGTFSFKARKICLPSDIPYANEWKSNAHTYQENSVEFWLSVLVLTRNFFLYYADRFKEGSWVFNICDSEMIFCLDLLYGSFHTKLSPEKLKKLMVAKGLDGEKIKKQNNSNDSRMYMIIPMNKKLIETRNQYKSTNLNWDKMVNEMLECGSATTFDLMRIAGTRLNRFLDDFPQHDLNLESILNCLL